MGKKNQPHQKTRTTVLGASFTAKGEKAKVSLDKNGYLQVVGTDGSKWPITLQTIKQAYPRTKGPKILFSASNEIVNLDLNTSLAMFDKIYAVDTNTRFFNGDYYSVGVLTECTVLNKENFLAEYKIISIIQSTNNEKYDNIEQYMWESSIKHLQTYPFSNETKIALVVDSALDKIDQYNKRLLPIVNLFFLPKNFTLIYASADSGSENLANTLIKFCDKEASKYLNEKLTL